MTAPPPPRLSIRRTVVVATVLVFVAGGPALVASDADAPSRIPGLNFEAELILDSIAMLDGGASKGSALLGKSAVTFDLDTEQAHLWKGGRVLVQLLGTFGDKPSSMAGDLQVFDNIEAGDELGVLEAWIEQSLGSRGSILVGYHDLNREFDVVENAGELLNSSFGIGPEISQVGPSIFPKTHPGARLEIRPTSGTYLKLARYEGLESEEVEGAYYAVESGWTRSRGGRLETVKIAFGAWRLDSESSPEQDESTISGGYMLAEGTFVTAGGRSVGAFVRAGRADDHSKPIERFTGAGVRLGNFVTRRPEDVVSLGVARAEIAPAHDLAGTLRAETTIELTWLARVNEWIAIQPDVQYIDKPAGAPGIHHALVAGFRLIFTY